MCLYSGVKSVTVLTVYQRVTDGATDKQTSCGGIVRTLHNHCVVTDHENIYRIFHRALLYERRYGKKFCADLWLYSATRAVVEGIRRISTSQFLSVYTHLSYHN